MTVPSYNPNKITDTPPRGQCWVCDENNIPVAEQLRIPALCSEECRQTWVRMLAAAPEPIDWSRECYACIVKTSAYATHDERCPNRTGDAA